MKRIVKLTESRLKRIIREAVESELASSGSYGYPEGIDDVIVTTDNDRECHDFYAGIVAMVKKHYSRGEDITVDRLVNSPMMKRYQQKCFKKYAEIGGRNKRPVPLLFRQFMAERVINEIKNGEY